MAVVVEGTSWRCRDCGSTTWVATVVELAVEFHVATPCPYLDGVKP